MRWHQAARDLEDPEIAADADAEHLERAVPLRQQQPGASSSHHPQRHAPSSYSSSRASSSTNAAAAASETSFPPHASTHRGGRHGLLPPPPWAVVVRDIERDRRSSSGGEAGDFGSSHPSPSPSASTSSWTSGGGGNVEPEDEEEEEEEGAEAEDALESAKLLLAGGVAGAVSKTATAPLARLTILYQVQGMMTSAASSAASSAAGSSAAAAASSSATSAAAATATTTVSPIAGLPLRQALRAVVEREGVASLWRGNLVTVLHRLPYSAVNFWAYERLSEAWIAAEDRRSSSDESESGHGGGGESGSEGGEVSEGGEALKRPSSSDTARRLACGGAAGMAACTLAYPLDLVRTRLAASSSPVFNSSSSSSSIGSGGAKIQHQPRLSVARTLADVVRADGPRGLYRGLGATLAQVGPSLALNYTAYGALRAKWMSGKEPGEPPTVREEFFFFFFFASTGAQKQFFFFSHLFFLSFFLSFSPLFISKSNTTHKKWKTDNDVPGLRGRGGTHQLHRDVPARPREAEDAARRRRRRRKRELSFFFGERFLLQAASRPDVRRSRPRRPLPRRSRRVLRGDHARVL